MVVDLGEEEKKLFVCLLFVSQAVCVWLVFSERKPASGRLVRRGAAPLNGQPPLGLPAPAAGGEERTGDEGRLPWGGGGGAQTEPYP